MGLSKSALARILTLLAVILPVKGIKGDASLRLFSSFIFLTSSPKRKFEEEDFEIMADWGFDFARIPMSYWNWSTKEDWFTINEDVMTDIDEVVEFGRQYNIHINLGFHRVPGYCINGRELEPYDLFDDTPENMQKALDGVVYHALRSDVGFP